MKKQKSELRNFHKKYLHTNWKTDLDLLLLVATTQCWHFDLEWPPGWIQVVLHHLNNNKIKNKQIRGCV
jgi:hypothetical protein